MAKIPLPKILSSYLEFSQFFRVKDEDRKFVLEADGNLPAKTHIPSKRAQKNDFDEIYEREFKETALEDNPENRKNWRGRLITDLHKKIDSHTSHKYLKDQNNELLAMADSFIQFLNDMDKKPGAINSEIRHLERTIEALQHTDPNNPNAVKKELHHHIFKYNAFEIFEKYFESKSITHRSRTDLRIIFVLLKGDNLLSDTFELKHYINWLNKVYFNGAIEELRVQYIKTKPNIVRENDYKNIRNATLKKP